MFDQDNTGKIDLNEFNQLWNYLGQWRQIFQQYDADRSGNISQQELGSALQQMGYRLFDSKGEISVSKFLFFRFSPQFIQSLYQKFDFNRDGRVMFDGFVHSIIMIQVGLLFVTRI